jgi:3D (Asp-Asp-Asp) domain-containing protein
VSAHSPSSGGPAPDRRRRRIGAALSLTLAVTLIAIGTAASVGVRLPAVDRAVAPIAVEPAVVLATLRLNGALVRGASRSWAVGREDPLRYGDPVPVELTAYCLQGTTRRDRYVRQGIVAADPRLFPLGRYLELYVGRKYYGRFLVDDTGARVRDGLLDIWTPTCREARLFGRRRGTAVLVPRPRGGMPDTLLTGRLGGVAAP